MKDHIGEYLATVRDELYRLAENHEMCFEEHREECQFDKMTEVADLLDEIVCYRQPFQMDYDAMNKMHKEQDVSNERS